MCPCCFIRRLSKSTVTEFMMTVINSIKKNDHSAEEVWMEGLEKKKEGNFNPQNEEQILMKIGRTLHWFRLETKTFEIDEITYSVNFVEFLYIDYFILLSCRVKKYGGESKKLKCWADPPDGILCLHRADECKSLLVDQHWCVHARESTGVHSSSLLHEQWTFLWWLSIIIFMVGWVLL